MVVAQRIAYKVTTKRKHSDAVADNLLNMNFNPLGPNQVWAGGVSYLKTGEGSQYTSKRFRNLLKRLICRSRMGDVGACWNNAVVEKFFGSLKHDWLFRAAQPTREHMTQDVARYVKYYNLERLHLSNGDQSPIESGNSFRNVSGWT